MFKNNFATCRHETKVLSLKWNPNGSKTLYQNPKLIHVSNFGSCIYMTHN